MATRVWLNRWFSSGWNVVRFLREGGRELDIWATHDDPDSVVLAAADHTGHEPSLHGDDYVDWALDHCRTNRIEAFLPLNRLVAVAGRAADFEAIGTRVMVCADGPTITELSDKVLLADLAVEYGMSPVPEHVVVTDLEGFRAAVAQIAADGRRACLKPVGGEGGSGFRILDDGDPSRLLLGPAGWRIPTAEAERALAASVPFPALIVAEYLDGPEWSIDCLGDRGRLLAAVPRRKGAGRVQVLDGDPTLLALAERVCSHFGLSYLFNVQVRASASGGPAKLLEVNPRASAGLNVACVSGVNMPARALDLLLDGTVDPGTPTYGAEVSRIEIEVALREPHHA